MDEGFFVRRADLIASWRHICGFLADMWGWQPSELKELDLDELEEWFEVAQSINEAKAQAYKDAARNKP